MRKVVWAALCAAGVMACAGQAGARVIQFSLSGDLFDFSGPAGFFPPPSGAATDCTFPYDGVGVCTNGGMESVLYAVGGSAFSMTFAYDSLLGKRTTTATSDEITWSAGEGHDPLLSGEIVWPDATFTMDLVTDATSVDIRRDANGYQLQLEGLGWIVNSNGSAEPPASPSLDDPLQQGAGLTAFQFGKGDVDAFGGEFFSEQAVRVVPEPATWVLLILGFGSAGLRLRRAAHLISSKR